MATISAYKAGQTHYTRTNARVPYVAEWVIDFAKTTVASGDVVEALYLPKGTAVLFAGAQVKEASTATGAVTVAIGPGTDPDQYVASLNAKAADGTYGTPAATAGDVFFAAAADTIDITVTGDPTDGKIRVFAVLTTVEEVPAPGIAQLGS